VLIVNTCFYIGIERIIFNVSSFYFHLSGINTHFLEKYDVHTTTSVAQPILRPETVLTRNVTPNLEIFDKPN